MGTGANAWWGGFCSDISGLFSELHEATQGMEQGLRQRVPVWEDAVERATDEQDRAVEEHTLKWLASAVPRVMRSSLVVSTHSVIESSLAAVCRRIRDDRSLSLSPPDLSGRGISRSRNYLVKVAGLDLGDLDARLATLRDWSLVRDCLVHANGEVEQMNNSKQVVQAIQRIDGLALAEASLGFAGFTTVIEIQPQACQSFIGLGSDLLGAVLVKAFGPAPWSE